MAFFRVRSISGDGEVFFQDIDAESQSAVIERLRRLGQMPLAIDAMDHGSQGSWAGRLRDLLATPIFQRAKISQQELAMLTRELKTLLEAGLALDHALRLLSELAARAGSRRLLVDLLEQVQGGATLSSALARHDDVFSAVYVNVVRAGESGGSLEQVLGELADHLEKARAFHEQLRSALIYPALLLTMAALSIMILLIVVVPQFMPLFANAGADLPLVTKVVVACAEFFGEWWLHGLLGVAALGLYGRVALMRLEVRRMVDGWWLTLPVLGHLLVKIDTARLSRTLGTLLYNGVTLPHALAIAGETMTNLVLREALKEAADAAKEGSGLARALGHTARFPKLATHLLAVGEEAGQLDGMLLKIAEIFDGDVRQTTDRFMTLLVPMLTIVIGVIIATIIGAVMAAILAAYRLPL